MFYFENNEKWSLIINSQRFRSALNREKTRGEMILILPKLFNKIMLPVFSQRTVKRKLEMLTNNDFT